MVKLNDYKRELASFNLAKWVSLHSNKQVYKIGRDEVHF